MKVDVYNLKGEKIDQIDLRSDVFGIEPNLDVLHQYVRVYENNRRQGTSSTKTRSEVSGGGTKPWRQKGTGRARHGSIRSPIWVGGGVAHGPKPKSWRLSLPKKMRELALKSALSLRMKEKNIMVLEDPKIKEPKTKDFAQTLKKLKIDNKVSIIWSGDQESFVKSARNIPGVFLVNVCSLGAYDILKTSKIIFIKAAVGEVQERFKK
jgi:large subunit ribosomal protein L4